ncbi:hypothetical protein ADUPG1_013164 [Aduncisulcus paluster]|uniref:Reverse transcriptase/retrotransposon-derived protein RNase H-like domain-containing protein n=1 Tax=Aduncisulcus paluster TaxID=2918883 RepID=A0ABQ5K5K9_9EUKA|nr:hypothetical protein ADUPG1_013164 [Aduncisulcus paluster]
MQDRCTESPLFRFLHFGKVRSVDPGRLKLLRDLKPPETLKDLQSLMGKINFLREFISDYSRSAEPLTRLMTKKFNKTSWNEEQTSAWEDILNLLERHLTLEHPSQEGEFILRTDASTTGIGGILLQKDSAGREKLINLFSKKFSTTERWSTIEQEAFGVYYGITSNQGSNALREVTKKTPSVFEFMKERACDIFTPLQEKSDVELMNEFVKVTKVRKAPKNKLMCSICKHSCEKKLMPRHFMTQKHAKNVIDALKDSFGIKTLVQYGLKPSCYSKAESELNVSSSFSISDTKLRSEMYRIGVESSNLPTTGYYSLILDKSNTKDVGGCAVVAYTELKAKCIGVVKPVEGIETPSIRLSQAVIQLLEEKDSEWKHRCVTVITDGEAMMLKVANLLCLHLACKPQHCLAHQLNLLCQHYLTYYYPGLSDLQKGLSKIFKYKYALLAHHKLPHPSFSQTRWIENIKKLPLLKENWETWIDVCYDLYEEEETEELARVIKYLEDKEYHEGVNWIVLNLLHPIEKAITRIQGDVKKEFKVAPAVKARTRLTKIKESSSFFVSIMSLKPECWETSAPTKEDVEFAISLLHHKKISPSEIDDYIKRLQRHEGCKEFWELTDYEELKAIGKKAAAIPFSEHIPGKTNETADFLSRITSTPKQNHVVAAITSPPISKEQSLLLERVHTELGHASENLMVRVLKTRGITWSGMVRQARDVRQRCLRCQKVSKGKPVRINHHLRSSYIFECVKSMTVHTELGHASENLMVRVLKTRGITWSGMVRQARDVRQRCLRCQKGSKGKPVYKKQDDKIDEDKKFIIDELVLLMPAKTPKKHVPVLKGTYKIVSILGNEVRLKPLNGGSEFKVPHRRLRKFTQGKDTEDEMTRISSKDEEEFFVEKIFAKRYGGKKPMVWGAAAPRRKGWLRLTLRLGCESRP